MAPETTYDVHISAGIKNASKNIQNSIQTDSQRSTGSTMNS